MKGSDHCSDRAVKADEPLVCPDHELILSVLPQLYEAVLQARPWPQILSAMASVVFADKAIYVRLDRTHPRDSVTEMIGVSTEIFEMLRSRNFEADPLWLPLLLAQRVGRVFRSTELVPLEAAFCRPPVHAGLIPAELGYGLGVVIENNSSHFSVVGYFRPEGDFDEDAKNALQILAPHLQLAWGINQRVAIGDAGRREAEVSFERLPQAMVVLDRSGYAVLSNESARCLLVGAATEGMQLRFGRFIFDQVAIQTEFERAVRIVLTSMLSGPRIVPQEVRIPRHSHGSPYALTVTPLYRTDSRLLLPPGAGCVVLLADHDGVNPLPGDRLAWLYRLTPAEVRVCQALHQAGSVEGAAQSLNLTHHTVRSHLKHVYSKVGVANQSQLIQRLSNAAYPRFYDDMLGRP